MNVETNFTRHADGLLSSDELDLAQKSRRRKIIIGIAAVVLLAVVLGARLLGGNSAPTSGANAARQAPRVTIIVPGAREVESTISATGSLAARRDMPV
ncbi:MAG: efflux RND transporter periplasmic adaptor subunit, partial [Sphingomonadaceae bacterium]|nr:efflux RND transporter periplasmic adaptor subunit [Sphingomonadaceae bacterium]